MNGLSTCPKIGSVFFFRLETMLSESSEVALCDGELP